MGGNKHTFHVIAWNCSCYGRECSYILRYCMKLFMLWEGALIHFTLLHETVHAMWGNAHTFHVIVWNCSCYGRECSYFSRYCMKLFMLWEGMLILFMLLYETGHAMWGNAYTFHVSSVSLLLLSPLSSFKLIFRFEAVFHLSYLYSSELCYLTLIRIRIRLLKSS
jgi:hypothetical protein